MGQDPDRHNIDVQMVMSPGAHTAYGIGELKIKTDIRVHFWEWLKSQESKCWQVYGSEFLIYCRWKQQQQQQKNGRDHFWFGCVMVNLGCQLDRPRKREPQLRKCLHQAGWWACLWGIVLIVNWCGRAQPTLKVVPVLDRWSWAA